MATKKRFGCAIDNSYHADKYRSDKYHYSLKERCHICFNSYYSDPKTDNTDSYHKASPQDR